MEKLSDELLDRILLFIKFGEKKHLEDLQNGKLYMNNFQYYIDLEKKNNVKGRGDRFEGALIMKDIDVTLIPYDSPKSPISFKADSMELRSNDDMLKPVFCLTSISIRDLKDISVDTEKKQIRGILEFTEEQKEKIKKEFGDYALIISPHHFSQLVDERFKADGICYAAGKVKYSDYTKNYIDRIESCITNRTNVYFWKDKSLEYQKEYRIVVLNRNVKKPFIYDIGNIKYFTELKTTKELLNSKFEAIINCE